MYKLVLFIILSATQTMGYSQANSIEKAGSWAFKNNHCLANKFIHHRESQTIFDTTQVPHPKFIIDFYRSESIADGTFRVVQGPPMASDQVSIGVGWLHEGVLSFYSSTPGSDKAKVTVKMVNGKARISGSGIDMASQQNAKDRSPLTFDITIQ
jgi:hypothetical protein